MIYTTVNNYLEEKIISEFKSKLAAMCQTLCRRPTDRQTDRELHETWLREMKEVDLENK